MIAPLLHQSNPMFLLKRDYSQCAYGFTKGGRWLVTTCSKLFAGASRALITAPLFVLASVFNQIEESILQRQKVLRLLLYITVHILCKIFQPFIVFIFLVFYFNYKLLSFIRMVEERKKTYEILVLSPSFLQFWNHFSCSQLWLQFQQRPLTTKKETKLRIFYNEYFKIYLWRAFLKTF